MKDEKDPWEGFDMQAELDKDPWKPDPYWLVESCVGGVHFLMDVLKASNIDFKTFMVGRWGLFSDPCVIAFLQMDDFEDQIEYYFNGTQYDQKLLLNNYLKMKGYNYR